jgi:hypothetical protein
MSGEVETSRAEPDLTALEGFLVGNQDLERLEALLDHFNILEATGWYWVATRTSGCGGVQGPQRIERDASFTSSRKCGVRGDPARLPSRLHLHG